MRGEGAVRGQGIHGHTVKTAYLSRRLIKILSLVPPDAAETTPTPIDETRRISRGCAVRSARCGTAPLGLSCLCTSNRERDTLGRSILSRPFCKLM